MPLQKLRPAKARNGGDGEGNAAAADLSSHLHDESRVVALSHLLKYRVAPGFKAHVDHGQALGPQCLQFPVRANPDAVRRGVARHPATLREQLPDRIQNDFQLPCFSHQSVPVGQKNLLHPQIELPGLTEIRQDFLQRADGKPLLLVHTAKGAGIMAAPVGHLNDQAPGLGGRAVYAANISHFRIFSSADSFRQVQRTSAAVSSSSSGGRDGAMRILLSWGSFP